MDLVNIGDVEEKELRQKTLKDPSLDTANYFSGVANNLKGVFETELKKIDLKPQVNVKDIRRVLEKAAYEYECDCYRVLDYLRGTIFIELSTYDSKDDLLSVYKKICNCKAFKGKIKRVKKFRVEKWNALPRILLNIELKELIVEVQVHFHFIGLDRNFQDILHTIYELQRTPQQYFNDSHHVSNSV